MIISNERWEKLNKMFWMIKLSFETEWKDFNNTYGEFGVTLSELINSTDNHNLQKIDEILIKVDVYCQRIMLTDKSLSDAPQKHITNARFFFQTIKETDDKKEDKSESDKKLIDRINKLESRMQNLETKIQKLVIKPSDDIIYDCRG